MRKVLVMVVVSVCVCLAFKSYFADDNFYYNHQTTPISITVSPDASIDRADLYRRLQEVSVKVDCIFGSGSGVVFARDVAGKTVYFVWTAGHVAEVVKQEDETFGSLYIIQEKRVDGKLESTERYEAKVIAYSPSEGGEDLAVLEVVDDSFTCLSAVFAGSEIIPVGTEIIHCGSPHGLEDSISLGIMSQTDRDLMEDGKMFDQTSCMAYPGSSGGGMYDSEGRCVGLITRGAGAGLNFIVPMRRIRAWAESENLIWLLDSSVEVPLTRQPTVLEVQAQTVLP